MTMRGGSDSDRQGDGGNAGPVRLQNVQGLRALAAALVVFVHLSGSDGLLAMSFGVDPFRLMHAIGNAGVDLFFTISGLIMIVTTSRTKHTPASAGRFLLRRIVRIYPPYIAVTLVLFAQRELFPTGPIWPGDLLPSLLLLPQVGVPILFVGWTLVYEMYFYLVFTVSLFLPRRLQPFVFAAWAALIVTLACTIAPTAGNPVLSLIGSPLSLEFLFGALVGWLVLRGQLRLPWAAVITGVAGILATHFLLAGPEVSVTDAWFRTLGVGVPAALILYGCVGLESRGFLLPAAVNRFGDSSYALYLVHAPVLAAIGTVAYRLPHTALSAVCVGLAAAAVCFVVALGFRRWVEQPLLDLLQPLTRTRTPDGHIEENQGLAERNR